MIMLSIESFAQSLDLGCPQFPVGTYVCTRENSADFKTLTIAPSTENILAGYSFETSGEDADKVICAKIKEITYVCNNQHRSRSSLDKLYCDKIATNIEYQKTTWSQLSVDSITIYSLLSRRLLGSESHFTGFIEQVKSYEVVSPFVVRYSKTVKNIANDTESTQIYTCSLRVTNKGIQK